LDEYRRANQGLWDEWTRINAASHLYDLQNFKTGRSSLHALEVAEVGDVQAKTLLHLQCHFGMDTLSWARRGAQVTGIDFSTEAMGLARSLAQELNLPARFIQSDLYDLPQHLNETFDLVFTSYGVLTWLNDIPRWAQIAASFVKPGGIFYIAEFHPTAYMFSDEKDDWVLETCYFNDGVTAWPVAGSYADPSAVVQTKTYYEWNYPLGTVVSSLIDAGLVVEFLHEFDYSTYPQFKFLVPGDDGLYRPPAGMPRLPLIFSLRARKPIRMPSYDIGSTQDHKR
jgi:ubiquinone/menaquinone biosynthesis C-methylase UbiE